MSLTEEEVTIKAMPHRGGKNKTEAIVAAIFTGGTIAVSESKTGTVAPALSGREILERVPDIARYLPAVSVQVHDFATLPSPHISPEIMLSLAGFVYAVMDYADGFVITHGTDSMEETAYFLDLITPRDKTIVLTGSMHTSGDAAWDGGRNLVDAIAVAASPAFRGMGTLVVMNGDIHAASEVTKTHTKSVDAFRSLDFGPVGKVDIPALREPFRMREPMSRVFHPLPIGVELPYVEMLKTYSGMDDRLFIAALREGARAIVIEAMGQGNVPPGVVEGISRAREMNIPVVVTTRCQAGPVQPFYTYEGAGQELERLGCTFEPYLTGPKARIKWMLTIAAGEKERQG